MAAPNTQKSRSRTSRKITPPAFRPGIGLVYRELERTGQIPAEGIEKKAAYEAAREAREAELAQQKGLWHWLRSLVQGH